ncbi:hypothetical protein GCM10010170_039710 [Dactylosporangium salmoneum]|uniref:Uncharacterized protein n=1 Tax=Dactylosporangium salmoneum TaxID=53361 RepID=A0ABN3GFA2_9ACTN
MAVTSLPNVSLGIIPLMVERGAVASAGFWIFDDVPVALETPTAGLEVSRPSEIGLYERIFAKVTAKGSGRVSLAGLTCYRPGQRSRLIYRAMAHKGHKGEKNGFREAFLTAR